MTPKSVTSDASSNAHEAPHTHQKKLRRHSKQSLNQLNDAERELIRKIANSHQESSPSEHTQLQKQDIIQLHRMVAHHHHNHHQHHPHSHQHSHKKSYEDQRSHYSLHSNTPVPGGTRKSHSRSKYSHHTSKHGHSSQPEPQVAPIPAPVQVVVKVVQEPTKATEPIPDPNLYIYDKFAPIYTPRQLGLALKRAALASFLCSLTLWLLFIYAAIILDYLEYDPYVLKASTFEIDSSLDMGTIKNLRQGHFGWPFLLIMVVSASAFISIGLLADSFTAAITTSTVLFCLNTLIIIQALLKSNLNYKDPDKANLLVIGVVGVIFYIAHTVMLAILIYYVRKMEDTDEFPQDKTITMKKAEKVASSKI